MCCLKTPFMRVRVEQASRLFVLASRQNIPLRKGILAGRQNEPAGRRFHPETINSGAFQTGS